MKTADGGSASVFAGIDNGFPLSSSSLANTPGQRQSLASLSRALVQLFHERAGRGPTEARTFWAGDDAVLVLFAVGYTKAEQTLWDHGRSRTAASFRHAVLETLESDMRSVVEGSLGRQVVAVLADAHHDPDVMAAVFLLEAPDLPRG